MTDRDGTLHVGDATFPPGSTAGLVVHRDPATGELEPEPVGQDVYAMASRELAQVAAEWALRQGGDSLDSHRPRTFQEAVLDVIVQCWHVMMYKRHLRGVANLREQGELGLLNRVIKDKGARLLNEAERERFVEQARGYGIPADILAKYVPVVTEGETFEDDLIDSTNYYILLMLLRGPHLDAPYRGTIYEG